MLILDFREIHSDMELGMYTANLMRFTVVRDDVWNLRSKGSVLHIIIIIIITYV